MAVDTRDKRFSMLGLASPDVREQQNPTGTVGAVARAMLLFLYAGISLVPITVVGSDNVPVSLDLPELGGVSPGTVLLGQPGGLT